MWLIAINTYKIFWRRKIVYVFSFVAFLIILFSAVLSQLVLSEQLKIVVDFSLAGIELVWLIFVLFFGTRLLEEEKEHKTIELLHLKVKHIFSILLWKYLWFVLLLMTYFFMLSFLYSLFILWQWADLLLLWWSFISIFFIFLKILVVLAFVILISLLLSPVFSLFLWLIFYFLAHGTAFLKYYYSFVWQDLLFMKWVSNFLYYLLPQFDVLNIKEFLFSSIVLSTYNGGVIFFIIIFHLCYIFLLLFFAVIVYWKRRNV